MARRHTTSTSYERIVIQVTCDCGNHQATVYRHEVHDALVGLARRKCGACGATSDTGTVFYTYIDSAEDSE